MLGIVLWMFYRVPESLASMALLLYWEATQVVQGTPNHLVATVAVYGV